MGFRKEHIQSIADRLAIEQYGRNFDQLTDDFKDKLINEAIQIANREISEIVKNAK